MRELVALKPRYPHVNKRIIVMCGSKPNDEDFTGPLKKRSCTDVFCLFFFLAFIGGMGYVGFLGFDNGGDPYKLVYGMDSWGNTCNRKNTPILNAGISGQDLTGYKKTFYFNFFAQIISTLESNVMCVKACPKPPETLTDAPSFKAYAQSENLKLCRYDVEFNNYFNDLTAQQCPAIFSSDPHDYAFGFEEHSAILSRCVPQSARVMTASVVQGLANSLPSAIASCESQGGDILTQMLHDIQSTWQEIAYLSAMSVGVAFIVTILLRFFAVIIIWTLMAGCALGALGGTGFLWYRYFTYKDSTDVSKHAQAQDWLIYAAVVSAATLILLLILLIMRKRIALVVQLFREAGKAVAKMPLLLVQPLWSFLWLVILVSATGAVYTFVETAGTPVVDETTHEVTFEKIEELKYLKWYYLFGVLWIIQFVFACHQTIIAGSVANWYFAEDKKKLGSPILVSIKRLILYHLGSVAFGAFIVALIQFLRILLSVISRRLRGRTNKVVDFFLKCLACCLWCFEKVIKYLNRNAYIMVAIHGYSFCAGARRAFTLLLSNALRVAAINSVGTFVLFLAKVGITALTVFVGLEILKTKTELCYVWVPLTLVGIAAFMIANIFLSVYGMAIDTIFLCFCEDCERNDGVTKPYYMSKGLMEYVANASEALAAAQKREAAATVDYVNAPNTKTNKGSAAVQW